MGTSEYARPELLAEPDWVWEHQSETFVRVVDCGPGAAYWRAHVPGAIGLPIDSWLKDSADGRYVIGPDAFAEVMSTLGVKHRVTVVIYDGDENAMLATRLWWVLAYYGHKSLRERPPPRREACRRGSPTRPSLRRMRARSSSRVVRAQTHPSVRPDARLAVDDSATSPRPGQAPPSPLRA